MKKIDLHESFGSVSTLEQEAEVLVRQSQLDMWNAPTDAYSSDHAKKCTDAVNALRQEVSLALDRGDRIQLSSGEISGWGADVLSNVLKSNTRLYSIGLFVNPEHLTSSVAKKLSEALTANSGPNSIRIDFGSYQSDPDSDSTLSGFLSAFLGHNSSLRGLDFGSVGSSPMTPTIVHNLFEFVQNNIQLTSLTFRRPRSDFDLDNVFMTGLTKALKGFSSLTRLDLEGVQVTSQSMDELKKVLLRNPYLVSLAMSGDYTMDDAVMVSMTDALKNISVLRKLDLGSLHIGGLGFHALSEFVRDNSSLKSLRLSVDSQDYQQIKAFAEALKINKSLTFGHFYCFGVLNSEGIDNVAKALEENQYLTYIFLDNAWRDAERIGFTEALRTNTSLTSLSLGMPSSHLDAFLSLFAGRITPLLDVGGIDPVSHPPTVKIQRDKVQEVAHKLVNLYCREEEEKVGYPSCKEIFEQRDKESKISQPFGIFKLFQSVPSDAFERYIIMAKEDRAFAKEDWECWARIRSDIRSGRNTQGTFADKMIKDTKECIGNNYFYLLGVCKHFSKESQAKSPDMLGMLPNDTEGAQQKSADAKKVTFTSLTEDIVKLIVSFIGPHNLWITDKNYRKLYLSEIDSVSAAKQTPAMRESENVEGAAQADGAASINAGVELVNEPGGAEITQVTGESVEAGL
jgi:hypothetical protein